MNGVLLALTMMLSLAQSPVQSSVSVGKLKPLVLPAWPSDVLFVSDSLSLGLENFNLSFSNNNSAAGDVAMNGRVQLLYNRTFESQRLGYSFSFALELGGGFRVPPSDAANERVSGNVTLFPNAQATLRYYPTAESNQLFLVASGESLYQFVHVTLQPFQGVGKGSKHGLFLNGYAGVGYGRMLDVSSLVRWKKLESYLMKQKLLHKAIPAALKRKILLHWYVLRNRIGTSLQLAYTVSLLKKAGLLRRPLSLFEMYAVIQIIADPQIAERWRGWRSRVAFHAVYSKVDSVPGLVTPEVFKGEVIPSQLGAHAYTTYGLLLGDDKVLLISAAINSTFGAVSQSFSSLSVSTLGRFVWYLYNQTMDPLGAFYVTWSLGLGGAFSDNDETVSNNHQFSYASAHYQRLSVGEVRMYGNVDVGYQYALTRATTVRIGLRGSFLQDPSIPFAATVGLSASVLFGIANGSYAHANLSS